MSTLAIGDYITASTHTYSQKWMLREGYEDCNATYSGYIVKLGSNVTDIMIKLDDGTIRPAVADVGSSGWYEITKK